MSNSKQFGFQRLNSEKNSQKGIKIGHSTRMKFQKLRDKFSAVCICCTCCCLLTIVFLATLLFATYHCK